MERWPASLPIWQKWPTSIQARRRYQSVLLMNNNMIEIVTHCQIGSLQY